MSTSRVRTEAFVLDGSEDADHGFTLESLDGIDDAPDVRRQKIERQQAHGSHPVRGYRDERLIIADGLCLTTSPEEQKEFGNVLKAWLADGEFGRIDVDHQGLTVWMEVGLHSLSWDILVYGETARYQLQMLAPDPRMYGDEHRFPPVGAAGPLQEVQVLHYGNFPAAPRFVVDGTIVEDYAVYGPGTGDSRKRYKVNGTVTNGHPNLIDLADGYCYVDGAIRRGVVEDATTWTVAGGTPMSHTLDSNGNPASLVVYITDTYI